MGRLEEFPPVCTNDEVRQYFAGKNLTYDDITDGQILALVLMLNEEFKKSNRTGETSVNTMHLSRKIIIKHKSNGSISECYLFMNSHYFTQRECVSFNKNGFIGIAGWADDGNANPIRRALLRWCDTLAIEKTVPKRRRPSATEELFSAVRTIKEHCKGFDCGEKCPLFAYCGMEGIFSRCSPRFWPDPEEGAKTGSRKGQGDV